MENRGYEDDNKHPNDHHLLHHNQYIQQQQQEPINSSDIEGHIYEDIVTNIDKKLPDNYNNNKSIFNNNIINMNSHQSSWLTDNNEQIFHRNLTLPLRRDRSGLINNEMRYSVRIPTNDNNNNNLQYSCENFETSETNSVADSSSEKPTRRRRKRDCKHCKMKANDDTIKQSNQQLSFDESRTIIEPIFTLPSNIRIPNFNNSIGNLQNINNNNNNNNDCCINSCSIFTIANNNINNNNNINGACQNINYDKKIINYDKNDVDPRLGLIEEDKALLTPHQKHRNGMKVNSIYSPEQWRVKDTSVFIGDFNQQFHRAYSVPEQQQQQSPSSQNRVNLRRSVRGEPPPQPAQLSKNRHGWTLHFARSLDATNCTRSIVLLLIVILALLGIGSMALYFVFEPEKLQIIKEYLRSGERNNSLNINLTEHNNLKSVDDLNIMRALTTLKSIGISTTLPPPTTSTTMKAMTTTTAASTTTTTTTTMLPLIPETMTTIIIEKQETTIKPYLNITRYCDDCYDGEVCVALAGDKVPICRPGKDPNDPTGCSGLCIINKERCHRLDENAFRCESCEEGEWRCTDSLCIPSVKRCDGHWNCYDHSDEDNCECDLRTHFQCGNETSCLPMEKRCDGKIDCWDASDEICFNHTLSCPSTNEFTCNNGQCIIKTRFCDGFVDCTDGSDEPHGCHGKCNKHEFTCGNGRCITRNLKCNKIDDCGDMSDEQHCRARPR
ncbi:putative uncharacterized protein DDB_G0282499 isoform X2 [Aphidius gifuensis]|nr:putative uncharacterized protein DDB_G0282499 isoform X2 [Aphidius gifuensis]XP_044011883.1 putative uncharacterized protein DDB_G0282499 isoform X2 [Aphidius gifuensis]